MRLRRLGLAGAIALGAVVALPAPAAGHATLTTTEPSADSVSADAPEVVALEFTEPVDVGLGAIKVLAPDGERVDQGTPRRLAGGTRLEVAVDAEPRGTYTVVWSVTSEDNHTISGTVLFSVGATSDSATVEDESTAPARTVGGVARWLAFAGTLAFVGALAFDTWIARGGRPVWRLAVGAGVAVALGTIGAVLAQTAISSGRTLAGAVGVLPEAFTTTRFGLLGLARMSLAVSAAALATVGHRRRRVFEIVAWPVAAGLVILPALSGHAWATSPRILAVGIDAFHLAATAAWVGGLLSLFVATAARREPETYLRFSRLAGWAVFAVVATGIASSYLQVRSLDALLGTGYGTLLIIKVAAVAILVFLGWLNRRGLREAEGDRLTAVRRLVRVEVVLAAIVLAVTAALVNRPPARSDLARPFSEVVPFEPGAGSVQAEVQPAKVGANDVHLYFLDAQGLPSPIDAVEVSVGRPGIPPRRVKVTPVTADHASAYAVAFPSPGVWTVEVSALRSAQTLTTSFEVRIR